MSRIVAIEDDPDIIAVYEKILGQTYSLTIAPTIASAYEELSSARPRCDLVIAGLSLPDGSFHDVSKSKEWRPILDRHPFLVVSVNDDLEILENCLHTWADDFLIKPFNNNELIIKCKKLIRSRPVLRLDTQNMVLVYNDLVSKELTAKEFKMLAHLLGQENWQCEPTAMLRAVWGEEAGIQRLHTGLSRLRGKLRPIGVEITSTMDGMFSLQRPDGSKLDE